MSLFHHTSFPTLINIHPIILSFSLPSAATVDAGAKPTDATTTSAASAAPVTAEDEASAKAAEAAMKEKIERLSGHMFAVM